MSNYSLQLILAVSVAIITYAIYAVKKDFSASHSHNIAIDGWFGRGKKRKDDERITPFKISVPEEAIQDLKFRLKNARINYEPLEDCNDFSYGFNSKYLKYVANYWLNKYNWKYHEGIINTLPQFTTEIEGLKIHFIHAKPMHNNYEVIVPLLILHGWPGNVFEFLKIIPLLVDPIQQIGSDISITFEIIAPSIPGFGWSAAPIKKGFNTEVAARIFNKLMIRLGFSRYLLQGGDWGSNIATNIAFYYPENVIGLHLNMALVFNWKALLYTAFGTITPRLAYSSQTFHQRATGAFLKDMLEETGYMHIQATKPDTIGAALNDSPIGLAAYILEKFSYGTNTTYRSLHDGGLTKKFTLDELLTIVSIYWFNNNIINAIRLYKEYFQNTPIFNKFNRYISIPTGYAAFPEDLMKQPEELMRTMYNITNYTEIKAGGHFAAFEEPKLLASDIIKFVKTIQLE
uniref:Epoxide hydrolase n=2 Tax=Brugia malayi TaxID=6279 RepID=A0A0I9NBD4_BRUMA|nr:Bm6095, isoform a [Brugia malayi]